MVPNRVTGNFYLLIVNNRNTKKRCEICSKLTLKTPERRCRSTVNISCAHSSSVLITNSRFNNFHNIS